MKSQVWAGIIVVLLGTLAYVGVHRYSRDWIRHRLSSGILALKHPAGSVLVRELTAGRTTPGQEDHCDRLVVELRQMPSVIDTAAIRRAYAGQQVPMPLGVPAASQAPELYFFGGPVPDDFLNGYTELSEWRLPAHPDPQRLYAVYAWAKRTRILDHHRCR